MNDQRHVPLGEIHLLKRIYWSHFVTIELPHQKGIAGRAKSIWNGFRGSLAKLSGMRTRGKKRQHLLWVAALEFGSSKGNPHIHAYIGGLPSAATLREIRDSCALIVKRMQLPGVLIDEYENRPDVISYLFKELDAHAVRFTSDDGRWPIWSPNLPEVIRRGCT